MQEDAPHMLKVIGVEVFLSCGIRLVQIVIKIKTGLQIKINSL
jgi:hypothetical protein